MSLFSMTRPLVRSLFRKPATRLYPFEPAPVQPLRRGRIVIAVEDCVFCGMCSRKCPSDAIEVSRPAKTWAIDRLRCISCGYCVEVCPKKCLAMETAYTGPTFTKDTDLFRQKPKDTPAPAAKNPVP